jgi:hypothetical protein
MQNIGTHSSTCQCKNINILSSLIYTASKPLYTSRYPTSANQHISISAYQNIRISAYQHISISEYQCIPLPIQHPASSIQHPAHSTQHTAYSIQHTAHRHPDNSGIVSLLKSIQPLYLYTPIPLYLYTSIHRTTQHICTYELMHIYLYTA